MPPRIRKCILCGKEFEAPNGFVKRCPDQHYATCQVCGKQFPVNCEPNQIPKTCSRECQNILTVQKRDKTVKDRYGVDNVSHLASVRDKLRNPKTYNTAGLPLAEKQCEWCGQLFTPKSKNQKYCARPHYMCCVVCGKRYQVKENTELSKPPKACSRECGAILRKQNNNGISPGHTPQAIQKRNESRLSERKCALCGKSFIGVESSRYCQGPHYTSCVICGKQVEIPKGLEYITEWTCSDKCAQLKSEKTCIGRYGVRIASQSAQVRNHLSQIGLSDENKQKRMDTCIERYGVPFACQSDEVRSRISATVKSRVCQDKLRDSTFTRYGVPFAMQNEDVKKRQSDAVQEKYGVPWACLTDNCLSSQGHTVSKLNRKLNSLLKDISISTKLEHRINDKSFDISLVDRNILIEIDPTYTHNSFGNHWNENGLDPNYHVSKTELAEKHSYQCIHVFDWDDWDRIAAIVNLNKRRYYARKLEIREVSKQTANAFLTLNHLQGKCNGNKVNLGLYSGNDLIQVMTFGKPRYNKNYEWELLRLCSREDSLVVGGAERLFKHFVVNYSPQSIISYCDRAKFSGEVYRRLGMSLKSTTQPGKVWSRGNEKVTDNLLRQRGYDQLFNANYGKGTSNDQLMLEHGWLPVYDCGQLVYEWKVGK